MESAFGIDHGYEIEKFSVGGALKPITGGFMHGLKGMHGPVGAPGSSRAIAGKVGGATRQAGQFGMRNKKTLGIGAGVGAVGGAGAYGLSRRNQ